MLLSVPLIVTVLVQKYSRQVGNFSDKCIQRTTNNILNLVNAQRQYNASETFSRWCRELQSLSVHYNLPMNPSLLFCIILGRITTGLVSWELQQRTNFYVLCWSYCSLEHASCYGACELSNNAEKAVYRMCSSIVTSRKLYRLDKQRMLASAYFTKWHSNDLKTLTMYSNGIQIYSMFIKPLLRNPFIVCITK